MKRLSIAACLLATLFLVPAAARGADESGPAAGLIAAHGDAIVSIKFVLKARISLGGQSRDSEQSREVRGVLLDKEGFVLTASSHFEGLPRRLRRMLRGNAQVDAKPADIKVLYGAEEDEHDARLVAKDSDLGLAFLQILDVGDTKLSPIDLSAGVPTQVGADLLGLTRMARSFDCAPEVSRLYVTASVERPRPMWAVSGDFGDVGMPVFTTDGKVVGVLTLQEGTEGVESEDDGGGFLGMGGGPDMGLFVLPLSTVKPVVERAKARAAAAEDEDAGKEGGKEETPAPEDDGD